MKPVLVICFCTLLAGNSFCQSAKTAEEEAAIIRMPNDTTKVNRLNSYAASIQFFDPSRAVQRMNDAIELAQRINYSYGLSIAYGLRAGLLFYEMKLDSSKYLLDKAYSLVKNKHDNISKNQQADILNRYAAIDQRKQRYDSAVEKYLQAADIFSEIGDRSKIIYSYYNLSGIYKFLGDTAKTFSYARAANELAQQSGDMILKVRGLIVLAEAHNYAKQYDSLWLITNNGLPLAKKGEFAFAVGIFNNLQGKYFAEKAFMYDSAITRFNIALRIFEAINTPYDIALVLQNLGAAYLQNLDFGNAVKYAKSAVELSAKMGFEQVLYLSLLDLVKAEEQLGNVAESHKYLKQYVAVSDSIQSRNSQKKVYELEAKYQAQQKELSYLAQQKIIRGKNLLNYLLAGSVVLLLIIFSLLNKNYRNKQRMQQQRISDLEVQQQLTATEGVLKGEEQERTRIAKDLHDGLGGMLSGIKYSLGKLKDAIIPGSGGQLALDRNMDMLDSSVEEMRRLAHNMMPETLVKFGLDIALKDFCNNVNQSGALQVSYQSFNLDDLQLDQIRAVALYRVVQELINNTMKHAAASSAVVQISKTGEQLSVTVEDDGKGFNQQLLQHAKGIGWANIQNRIEFLKGSLDVKSEPGKGTSVHFELPL